MKEAFLTAGIPASCPSLYRQVHFFAGDPAALLEFEDSIEIPEARRATCSKGTATSSTKLFILRDIETERARESASVDFVAAPVDFTPETGLSGDRETATAQSVAEAFRRQKIDRVVADRTLPLIYAEMIRRVGIDIFCDVNRGIRERRMKTDWEIQAIRHSQQITETVMESTCRLIASARADEDGILVFDGKPLTSERVRGMIDRNLLDLGFSNPASSIVAGKKDGGDCHALGNGPLRTGEPIIVDIFPQDKTSLYFGDCTRSIIHGVIDPLYQKMADAVRAAKEAATRVIRPGVTGDDVHRTTIATLEKFGFGYAAPGSVEAKNEIRLTHGTGHGLGLSCHEPPLLDFEGPELLVGDVVSVEPGLYSQKWGGIRIEDMVVVTENGAVQLGQPIPETLVWN